MYVFVDEAGDLGFKFERSSSALFIVAAVAIEDPTILNQAIGDLRNALGMTSRDELKFNSASTQTRRRFFELLADYDVQIVATIVNKQMLAHPQRMKADNLYRQTVRETLHQIEPTLNRARIVIDESVSSKTWKRDATTYLRQYFNTEETRRITDIRFRSSRQDFALRATDMVCGALHLWASRSDDRYIAPIRTLITSVVWQPNQTPKTP